MRSFVALGVVSMVAVASMAACGDDSSDARPGLGGTGGATGGTSGGGTGGATAGTSAGGTGGVAAGGAGGTGGAPTAPASNCTGCVQLTMPAGGTLPTGATNFQAGYIFSAPATAAPFDLSDVTTITWRVQALTTSANYYIQPILQNAPPEDPAYAFGFYPGNIALTAAAFAPGAWVDVVLDVAAIGTVVGDAGADAGEPPPVAVDAGDAGIVLTAFDKSRTRTIGLNVGALPTTPAGSIVSIEVDSVTVAGTSNFTTKTFTANAEGLTLNLYQQPTGTLPPAFH